MNQEKKINVTIVTTWNTRCGIASYSKYLVSQLQHYVNINVAEVTNQSTMNPLFFIKTVSLTRKDCDIIHFQDGIYSMKGTIFLSILSRIIIRSLPNRPLVVSTMHELVPDEPHTQQIGQILCKKTIKLIKSLVNHLIVITSDYLIVHTCESQIIVKGLYHKESSVIPHGSPEPIFMDKNYCKSKLNLDGHRILCIFGYIEPYKGYDTIIDILPNLPQDVILLIAGGSKKDTPLLQKLRNNAAKDPKIRITGYISDADLPTILNAVDIFLFPYQRITQSGPLALALAYEKPIITSDLVAFREIKEKYNCIEIAKDPNEYIEYITQTICDSPKKSKLLESINRYNEDTNWKSVAKQHYTLYKRVLMKAPQNSSNHDNTCQVYQSQK